jgi:hypothetical protein
MSLFVDFSNIEYYKILFQLDANLLQDLKCSINYINVLIDVINAKKVYFIFAVIIS